MNVSNRSNLRDYGRPNFEKHGTPRFVRMLPESELKGDGCPHCGCKHIAELEIDIRDARLNGGKGVGKYLGCPACPWASPMVVIAKGPERAEGSEAP